VHLTRAFARQFGVPPHIYLNAVRLERAQAAMLAGQGLAEVAAACGFADQSHFSRRFKGSVGLSPGRLVAADEVICGLGFRGTKAIVRRCLHPTSPGAMRSKKKPKPKQKIA
jgi:AraC-like DNA-binding protein